MNLNQAFSGIHGGFGAPAISKSEQLSKEKLFHGIHENHKTKNIKNQQMWDYHMYKNKQPWEMNPNAGNMFNGFNSQVEKNEYLTQDRYRNTDELTPSYYDEKSYGQFDTVHKLPTPLDNDRMYQYHTNEDSQGLPSVIDMRANESRNYKVRRSQRNDEFESRQNVDLQSHFFTPMSGMAYEPQNDPTQMLLPVNTTQGARRPQNQPQNQQFDPNGYGGYESYGGVSGGFEF